MTTRIKLGNFGRFTTCFNQDYDKLRLVLLLSPTRSSTSEITRRLRGVLSTQSFESNLQVYILWQAVLAADTQFGPDETLIDPGITQFWDEQKIAGKWFARHVEEFQGIVWDAFYLYRPEAYQTTSLLQHPLVSGGNVLTQWHKLEYALHFSQQWHHLPAYASA